MNSFSATRSIYFWAILLCVIVTGVLCRGSILWIFLNTRWNYWLIVVVAAVLVVLPRILFSNFTAHYRRAILSNSDAHGERTIALSGSAASKHYDYKWYLISGLTLMVGPGIMAFVASDWTTLFVMLAFVLCCSLAFSIWSLRTPSGSRNIYIFGFGIVCIALIGLVTARFDDWRHAFVDPARWYRFTLLGCCFMFAMLVLLNARAERPRFEASDVDGH